MSPRSSDAVSTDPLRPADHADAEGDGSIAVPALGLVGWLRWGWRQLTSMRTALVLLLLLAIAAIPGSMFPQRSADPNGVVQWQKDNPDIFGVVDWFRLFDVYSSPWFSAIYILLFVSLIGCIIPRTKHHAKALRADPPRTPARLSRLADHRADEFEVPGDADEEAAHAISVAEQQLKSGGYRVQRYDGRGAYSVSGERGYARETGNLLFHVSLVGVLVSVGIGGAVSYNGQTVLVQDRTFVNQQMDYASLTQGPLVGETALVPYAMTLDSFDVTYTEKGQAGNFAANLTVRAPDGETSQQTVRVNHPLDLWGDRVFLLGNGYAPHLTVRDADDTVVFSGSVPFLPQDNSTMLSMGVLKITDGLPEQLGMLGFFYPTAAEMDTGALTSIFPDLKLPMVTLDVYAGDLGIDDGTPRNVYTLQTDNLRQLTGRAVETDSIKLEPGMTAKLPEGMGSITFDDMSPTGAADLSQSVPRYVSLQMHHDPTTWFVLAFAVLALAGLLLALFIPRRRVWVKAVPKDGRVTLEYAGLARGEDPQIATAVEAIADRHQTALATPKVD